MIDATVGASHQDQRLAERIGVSGCPAIVVLNKWDLVNVDDRDDVLAGVGDRLAFLGSAPVLKLSAKSGKGVHRILPALRDSVEAYHQRVPTGLPQPGHAGDPAAPVRPAGPHPLHRAGGHRPADLHPLHQRAPAPDLHPLHRAGTAREVRIRRHSDEAAGPYRRQVVAWCEECDTLVEDEDLGEEGECPACGTILAEQERPPIPWYFKFMLLATVVYLGSAHRSNWVVGHVWASRLSRAQLPVGSLPWPYTRSTGAHRSIDPEAYVHPDAVVIGDVTIGAESTVWPGAVLRGDYGTITIGARTSVQDGTVIHATAQVSTTVGDGCVIGHLAHLEGCVLENDCLVGSGSVVLHRAVIGYGATVGANAVVTNNMTVPGRGPGGRGPSRHQGGQISVVVQPGCGRPLRGQRQALQGYLGAARPPRMTLANPRMASMNPTGLR